METTLELFRPLAEAILRHWKPETFDETLLEIGDGKEVDHLRDYVY